MGETCRLAILGCVFGCAPAFIAGRLGTQTVYLSPWLTSSASEESSSPAAFLVSSLFLFGVAICASYAPARRALCLDPMVALQHESLRPTDRVVVRGPRTVCAYDSGPPLPRTTMELLRVIGSDSVGFR